MYPLMFRVCDGGLLLAVIVLVSKGVYLNESTGESIDLVAFAALFLLLFRREANSEFSNADEPQSPSSSLLLWIYGIAAMLLVFLAKG